MKDLTHYFVSPPKSNENGENSSTVITTSKKVKNCIETTSVIENGDNKVNENVGEKRSRVKIRISLKESSKNNSCDIISSKNDVVDKTPSPLKRQITKKGVLEVQNESVDGVDDKKYANDTESREETTNAFQLLMTRNKPANVYRNNDNDDQSATPSAETTTEEFNKKDVKARLEQTKEKLVVLAERKGYSKRKLEEIEEAEIIENRLEKRAKLFVKTGKDDKKEKEIKKKKKDRGMKNSAERSSNVTCDNLDNNNVKDKDRKSLSTRARRNSGVNSNGEIRLSQSENYSPFNVTEQTPKSKTKWTLRVKLQSHSDDECDDNRDYNGQNGSDDDHIFTPKSKVKYKKNRVRKTSDDTEAKELKKPETEPPESSKLRDKKNRVKKSKKKLLSSEPGESKPDSILGKISSPVNVEEINTDQSVEIMDSNISELENEAPILQREKKLAPLFVRRSKPNPAALEARRSFLQSGIPDAVKKIINSEQKPGANDLGASFMPFPTVSHVSQSELNLEIESNSSEGCLRQKLCPKETLAAISLDLSKFKSLSNLGERIMRESRETSSEKFIKIDKENFETVLKDVESRCPETRAMWESVLSIGSVRSAKKSSPKSLKRTKKLKLQRKSDASTSDENIDNLNPTWTCKYKPMSSEEVVGNESATFKLRNWLSGWRISSPKDDRSSGDEFYSSDCSSSSYYENNQVAVLLGPHGSGKTASVYAIAEELGYRVLEVNASSRRTGKKILTDFQEATKSHRVKRDQSTLLMSKKKLTEKKVPQNSLILIEDVDLIFEEDEGFVSATFQLAANTRRPIVMTCRDQCIHLNRMAPQQQFIHFQTATGNRVSALLELIAFAESGYRLPKSCLDILLRNGDLRQSLLQLQYILLSGPPSFSQLGPNCGLTWQDLQPLVYKPAIKSSKKFRKESSDQNLIAKEDGDLVGSLANKLDTIGLISWLTEMENPASPPWRRKLNPSLSLLEDFQPYSNSVDLGDEIANWLRTASLGSSSGGISPDSKSQQFIKRKVELGIDVALSQAIPSTLEHRSKSTDYLPVIRDMCRSEENRASINTKRGKRFHNYLHGLNLASASSNILSAASSVFRDKLT